MEVYKSVVKDTRDIEDSKIDFNVVFAKGYISKQSLIIVVQETN